MKESPSQKSSLSVIIPCFNEEKNIADTVRTIEAALDGIIDDYELLIFNDCSTDGTRESVDCLARTHPRVRAIHNPMNLGLGYNYRTGIALATKEYCILVPGDNEITGASIRDICRHAGAADIVIPYINNYSVRPFSRRVLSMLFTHLANALTGFHLRYYNGPVLNKVSHLRTVKMNTNGFAYQVEVLVQLLRKGCSFKEVPMTLQPRSYGSSHAFDPKNMLSVLHTLAWIVRGS